MSKIMVACLAFVFSVATFADSEELINDGFVDGAIATFQAGFVPGEVAAVRFVPNLPCPCVVTDVSLLFGGSSQTQDMGLQIWEDSGIGNDPGLLLFSGTATLTGSNNNLQVIDVSQNSVIVNGPFRVGLEFNHAGAPTVATDTDGTIESFANFILADIGALFWFQSSTLGVSGDFIIRATVDNFAITDSDGDGVEDSSDNCTLVANAEQVDTDADGYGNACDGDFNNDCTVNFIDIASFSNQFLGTDVLFDLNNDSVVNFLDLSLLTELFLQAPGPGLSDGICESF